MAVKTEKAKKRRRYTKLVIEEASGVDRPAMEPAVAVALFKRAPELMPEMKQGELFPSSIGTSLGVDATTKGYVADEPALTVAADGHQHTLDLSSISGNTSWERGSGIVQADGSAEGHSHPYVMTAGGGVVIGEAAGHTHSGVAAIAAKEAGDGTNGDPDMAVKKDAAGAEKTDAERIAELEKSAAEEKAKRERAETISALGVAEKAHFDSLEGDKAEAFLKAKPEAQAEAVEAIKAQGDLAYTAEDGTRYTKADDPRLVLLAKRDDKREKKLAALTAKSANSDYALRVAKEVAHLPGEEADAIALLKAVDTIEDEAERGRVLSMLKANDAGIGQAFVRKGVNGETSSETDGEGNSEAERKLDVLTKAHAIATKVNYIKAYSEVTQTEEGAELLAETLAHPQPAFEAR